MSAPDHQKREQHYRAVRRVLAWVLVSNLLVTAVKITLGLVTGALSVVADGFHSLVDSSSNLIGLAAINLARRPADEGHPYGYRRYETLGALAIGGLLLVAAYEIGTAIVERYLHGTSPEITSLVFWLMLATFPVNLAVVILERRAGQRLGSEILLADAKHTQTDLYVTGSVLVSLVGIRLGWTWLDGVVAAGVVALIVRAAFEILGDTARWLTDTAVIDPERIEAIAAGAPGVRFVHRIRSRGTPDAAFVDLHVKVDPGMSTSRAHAVASEIERRLVSQIETVSDALVHIEPAKKAHQTPWEQISLDLRAVADGLDLGLHDLHIHSDENGDYTIELHLEMHGDLTLGEAHNLSDEFEQAVIRRWPQVAEVITHLEPLSENMLLPGGSPDGTHEDLIRTLLAQHVDQEQLLDFKLFTSGGHLHLGLTLCLPAETPLTEVHAFTEKLETDLLKQVPPLSRVTLHVEPHRLETQQKE